MAMTPDQCWEAGMCHTFILVNRLLSDAGSAERLYGLAMNGDGATGTCVPAIRLLMAYSDGLPAQVVETISSSPHANAEWVEVRTALVAAARDNPELDEMLRGILNGHAAD